MILCLLCFHQKRNKMNFPEISELAAQGFTPDQIADTLQLPKENVIAALQEDLGGENSTSLEELYARHQVDAVKILATIMKSSENDSARVTACKVILNKGGNFVEDTMKKFSDRFIKMREVVEKGRMVKMQTTISSSTEGTIETTLNLQAD